MRASDADRYKIADRLKAALDEGRLSLHEYDDRVREAWAARTYADLHGLVTDLPQPGLSAEDVNARRAAQRRREARKMPMALMARQQFRLADSTGGAALLAVTIGVQAIRLLDR